MLVKDKVKQLAVQLWWIICIPSVFYYCLPLLKHDMTTELLKPCSFAGSVQAIFTYQLFTNRTDGVLSNLSGRSSISLSMFANLTGSSCRKNAKEVLSHPLVEPMKQIQEKHVGTIFLQYTSTNCHLSPDFRITLTAKEHVISSQFSYVRTAAFMWQ